MLEDSKVERNEYPALMGKCFPPETLVRLESLRCVWQRRADGSPLSELAWLVLCAILRECSPVGTAQWQYVLPNKSKARVIDPFQAFEAKVYLAMPRMTRARTTSGWHAAKSIAVDLHLHSRLTVAPTPTIRSATESPSGRMFEGLLHEAFVIIETMNMSIVSALRIANVGRAFFPNP
jgi:hypothetical protein